MTNNWSNASLTEAVSDYIAGYECGKDSTEVAYEKAFESLITTEFPTLSNVKVDVTVGADVNIGSTMKVVVTATDPVAGVINVTATATITK